MLRFLTVQITQELSALKFLVLQCVAPFNAESLAIAIVRF